MTTLLSDCESLGDGVVATSLPHRIECGAPDFIATKGSATVGYIEAKDVGKSLDEAEKSEQLQRYLGSLTNLILTDYLQFRWYVNGECHLKARLGAPAKDGTIRRDRAGDEAVAELVSGFLSHRAESIGTPKELAQRMPIFLPIIGDGETDSSSPLFIPKKPALEVYHDLLLHQDSSPFLLGDVPFFRFAFLHIRQVSLCLSFASGLRN